MAVTFQSATTYPPATTTAATTSAVWAYPSGIVAGDALLLCAVNNNPGGSTATTFTTPSGWTSKESATAINTDTTCALYERTALGTESGTNLTLGMSASSLCCAAILRYNGNNPTAPFGDTSSVTTNSGSVTATSPTHAALSPAPGATDMVVRMYGYAQDSSGTGSAMSSPAGWTSRANLFTNVSGAFQCAIVVAELINGTGNVNITASSTGGWMVADAAIAISPFSVRSPVRVNQAVKRAAYY